MKKLLSNVLLFLVDYIPTIFRTVFAVLIVSLVLSRPPQHRHLKRKDSIRFLVFLAFSSIQAGRKIFSASAMTVWLFIQKQLCCFRICLMLPVVFLRRQIAVCFVDTLPVIKYPYILEHCGFGFLPCPEMLPVEPFLL